MKAWSRRERTRIVNHLVSEALTEIQAVAVRPAAATHPDGQLAHVERLADVCHRLPGADRRGDSLVWTWQAADEFQREWLVKQFDRLGVDTAPLLNAAGRTRSAYAPDIRPSWGQWQIPRQPGSFKAVDSATYATLVIGAWQVQRPGSAVREAFTEWFLTHLHPVGSHVLRVSRADETHFQTDGPEDLRQFRAVVTMCDGAVIVDHPRLRTGAFDSLPAGLGPLNRLRYASLPKRSRERDVGLWARDHRETHPDCPDWTAGPGPYSCSVIRSARRSA